MTILISSVRYPSSTTSTIRASSLSSAILTGKNCFTSLLCAARPSPRSVSTRRRTYGMTMVLVRVATSSRS